MRVSKLEQLETERKTLIEERDALNDKIVDLARKIDAIHTKNLSKIDSDLPESADQLQEITDLAWSNKAASGLLRRWFTSVDPDSFYETSRFPLDPDKNPNWPHYTTHKLTLRRGQDVEAPARAIEQMAPFMPLDDYIIDIFEHTCSEYGSYQMRYNRVTGLARVQVWRYHHLDDSADMVPLRDALKQVARDHWLREEGE